MTENKSRRILPRRPRKNAPAPQVTRDQITAAIRAFKNQGGMIHQLPPEVTERNARVGHRWDTLYEMPLQRD